MTTDRLSLLSALLCCALLLLSCDDGEDPLPAYTQDLAEMVTDGQGRAARLVLDNGESRAIANSVTGLVSDTTYRIRVLYTLTDGKAWLTNYAPVLTAQVTRYKEQSVITDPLAVTACWQGCNYINLRLTLTGTAKGVHYFGFHQSDLAENPDGSRTLHVLLLHDQNDDPLYYSREAYLSLPLRPLDTTLTAGRDSIRVSVHTFEGLRQFVFCHNAPL